MVRKKRNDKLMNYPQFIKHIDLFFFKYFAIILLSNIA